MGNFSRFIPPALAAFQAYQRGKRQEATLSKIVYLIPISLGLIFGGLVALSVSVVDWMAMEVGRPWAHVILAVVLLGSGSAVFLRTRRVVQPE